jgi:anti-anti-sigma factor
VTPGPARSLEIISSHNGDVVCVMVGGEIDFSTIGQLREAVRAHIESPAIRLVKLDLSGVTFCDCAGVGSFVGARLEARSAGTRVTIAAASAQVELLFSLFGLCAIFADTVETLPV